MVFFPTYIFFGGKFVHEWVWVVLFLSFSNKSNIDELEKY